MQRGSFQMMKSVNKSIVLNKIRINQPISRAQIAKEVKLTPPTVSSIVKELLEEKLVLETDLGVSKGGRKPTLLEINNKHHHVIGIDIGPSNIHCILTDLSGNTIKHFSEETTKSASETDFLHHLIKITDKIISLSNKPDAIIGIGIAMHGVVDVTTGTSLFAPNLNLKNIPIKKTLEDKFQLTVHVENDARAMALGEAWFGKHEHPSSMLVINLSNGVGAGAVVNGKLFHGHNDIAGEVGHMTIDRNGPVCECGNKGCFQTFATGKAIVHQANTLAKDNTYTYAEEVYEGAINGEKD
ncbi:MAG TPA: ROK family protein, partial [Pseudogracilibacillus sp.]|nr:ROK family protein [Pseudogracilibacillus sp.]